MNTPKTKPCPAVHDGIPCGGEMTYEPRQLEIRPTLNDPIGEEGSDPFWRCDTCDECEWVDDDPGTAPMFGAD